MQNDLWSKVRRNPWGWQYLWGLYSALGIGAGLQPAPHETEKRACHASGLVTPALQRSLFCSAAGKLGLCATSPGAAPWRWLFPGLAIAAAPVLRKWPPCLQSNRLLLSVVSSYETGLVVLTNRKTEQAQDRIRTARKKNLDCIRKET